MSTLRSILVFPIWCILLLSCAPASEGETVHEAHGSIQTSAPQPPVAFLQIPVNSSIFHTPGLRARSCQSEIVDEETRLTRIEDDFLELSRHRLSTEELNTGKWIEKMIICQYTRSDKTHVRVVDRLRMLSTAQNPVIAYHALFSLAYLQTQDTFSFLIRTLRMHVNGFVRAYAAYALGWLRDDRALPYLSQARADQFRARSSSAPDLYIPLVREAAKSSIFEIRSKREHWLR